MLQALSRGVRVWEARNTACRLRELQRKASPSSGRSLHSEKVNEGRSPCVIHLRFLFSPLPRCHSVESHLRASSITGGSHPVDSSNEVTAVIAFPTIRFIRLRGAPVSWEMTVDLVISMYPGASRFLTANGATSSSGTSVALGPRFSRPLRVSFEDEGSTMVQEQFVGRCWMDLGVRRSSIGRH